MRVVLIKIERLLESFLKMSKGGARLFSVVPRERARGSEPRLKYRRSHLNLRKDFFHCDIEHWNRLPRETLKSLALEILKT